MDPHDSAEKPELDMVPASRTSRQELRPVHEHPNLFVRGLPITWNEDHLAVFFRQYGSVSSLRLVRNSVSKVSLGYGFVRFDSVTAARAAIMALNHTSVEGYPLQVKFADADAGLPAPGAASGLTPSDSCYVKHLPPTVTSLEVERVFSPFGVVLEVKLFPCLDIVRGASAVVKMSSVAEARSAITGLNSTSLLGSERTLVVRFAESAAEKVTRLARAQRSQISSLPAVGPVSLTPHLSSEGIATNAASSPPATRVVASQTYSAEESETGASEAQIPADLAHSVAANCSPALAGSPQALQFMHVLRSIAAQTASQGGMASPFVAGFDGYPQSLQLEVPPTRLSLQLKEHHRAQEGLYPIRNVLVVHGLPTSADRLWLYEQFAPFGAVQRITIRELQGGERQGILTYMAAQDAARAVQERIQLGDAASHFSLHTEALL